MRTVSLVVMTTLQNSVGDKRSHFLQMGIAGVVGAYADKEHPQLFIRLLGIGEQRLDVRREVSGVIAN